jgi:hypothetical protein
MSGQSSEPNIERAQPQGPVTRPEHPIPVVARIRWIDGPTMDVPAIARSWTNDAVEITWEAPGQEYRTDWIPASDVRRSWTPPPPDPRGGT